MLDDADRVQREVEDAEDAVIDAASAYVAMPPVGLAHPGATDDGRDARRTDAE